MRSLFVTSSLGLLLFNGLLMTARAANGSGPWNLDALTSAPAVFPAPGFEQKGMQAIFYRGVPWRGHETRLFAYYGLPERKPGQKVPAVVLVHGGGGTAFPEWVRLWTARGYAALAMDWSGTVPRGDYPNRLRHDHAGPSSNGYGFDQLDWPKEDQWLYHAVAGIILANSFLRAQPEIDEGCIGLNGISWGGFLTCIAAGVDPRFKFAIPVYGCGYIYEDSVWATGINRLPDAKKKLWIQCWDPSNYLPHASMPMLWINGTNEANYYLDSWAKSTRLPRGKRQLALRVRMPHSHGDGWAPAEIYAFADQFCRQGSPLTRVTSQGRNGREAWATWAGKGSPVARAELNYTTETTAWPKRFWRTVEVPINRKIHKVHAALPAGTSAFYFNLYDQRGLLASTEHLEIGH